MKLVKHCGATEQSEKKVRMGVIFGPQENVTPNSELKKLYDSISDQVDIGKENKQQLIVLGYFNAKIGNYIKNNKETITKGGDRKHVHSKW